ncbi:MAG: DUF2878 domain-containing protein [Halioglobus sp.]|nr:DUF2878 domain-containing protein [Halioglobus sp.]
MTVTQRSPLDGIWGIVVNGTLFNISWFAIVLTHSPLIAPLVVVIHLAVHFSLLGRGMAEMRFIALVTALGAALDQVQFALGVFVVEGASSLGPLWLSCLWPAFATTLGHAFAGFRTRTLAAALVGGIGGGGSYVAGTRLSDVAFADPVLGPLVLGVTWAVVFPLLLRLAPLFMEELRDGN